VVGVVPIPTFGFGVVPIPTFGFGVGFGVKLDVLLDFKLDVSFCLGVGFDINYIFLYSNIHILYK
jgi:hypothetical protein